MTGALGQIKFTNPNFSGLFSSMADGFMSSVRSIVQGIPLPLIIGVGAIFLFMGTIQFLKDLKVIG